MADRVVILGGGVGGLSAAHELAERGYEVDVYERQPVLGGKARSIPVYEFHEQEYQGVDGPAITSTRGTLHSPWLPGEHGFRFFPGFYKHVVDTMARIPVGGARNAADNLVNTTRVEITQFDKPPVSVPVRFPESPADVVTLMRDAAALFGPTLDLGAGDLAFFASRIWQVMTSCEERRLGEYEKLAWWDFIDAESRSDTYRKLLGHGITRSLVAAKARIASTRTIGDIFIQLVTNMLRPDAGGGTDRVLNGPTNSAWIDPWKAHLKSLGVRYHTNATVQAIHCANGRIVGAAVEVDRIRREVRGDWYISAIPVERMAPLVSGEMVRTDPALGNLRALSRNVAWMNGIQFYLNRDIPCAHGHGLHVDTPWALTSISQRQFWPDYDLSRFSDGLVRGVLSVDVSDWETPGVFGKPARECSRRELQAEVWEQLKRSLNGGGRDLLRDEDLHYWFLDPDIRDNPRDPTRWQNLEPLLVNLVDTWKLRPEAVTAIPNFFLASDYVRTYTDLATMEAANEAARRAVNGILAATGSTAAPCQLWKLEEPASLAPWRAMDRQRYEAGLPWDDTLTRLIEPLLSAVTVAGNALPVSPIAAALEPTLVSLDRSASPTVVAIPVAPPVGSPVTSLGPAIPGTAPGIAPDEGPPGEQLDARLGWYRGLVQHALTTAIPAREPQRHLYSLIGDFLGRSGKGLRPALVLATGRAFGGRTSDLVSPAAAMEMLHNAFLVHDDIEDGSELRRDQPTMHVTHGVPLAVNTGDAMTALSLRIFREGVAALGSARPGQVLAEVDHMLVETLEGQAMELGWVRDNNTALTEADYLRMVLKKTCWYSFIHPMRIGALVARSDDTRLDRFNLFGYLLGAAFQIQDDVLNLVGLRARYGKEIGGDLLEGKRTLMVVHLLSRLQGADARRIRDFFSRPRDRKLPREIHHLHGLMDRHGSIDHARSMAGDLLDGARREFSTAFDGARPSPDLDFLRRLMDYMVQRQA